MKKLILMLLMLVMSLSFVSAVDRLPIIDLVAQDTGSSVDIYAVAFDREDNAGINYIQLYENSVMVYEEQCNGESTCILNEGEALNRPYPSSGNVDYYARTQDLGGNIVQSNTVTLDLAPSLLNILVTVVSNSEVTISWDTDELSDSRVRYGLVSGSYTDEEYDLTMIVGHSVALTGLSEAETYYFVIESTDSASKTATSGEGTFIPRDLLSPIISNMDVNVPTSAPIDIVVTWDTDELSDSRVRYGTMSGVYGSQQYDAVPVLGHSVILPGLADDTTYYFVIESTDTDLPFGNTATTLEYVLSTPDFTGPVIGGITLENPELGTVIIRWDTDELASGSVRYGTTTGVYDTTVDGDIVFLDENHEITLTGLIDGQTYYFVIDSVDTHGNSFTSLEQNFGVGNLIITFREPDDGDDYYLGGKIEGELRVRNLDINEIDADVTIILYDDTENDEIFEIELDEDIDSGDYEDFVFEIDLSYNLDIGNDYKLIARVDVDEGTYEREIDIDLNRKNNDVYIKNLGLYSTSEDVEVNVEVVNRGKRDQEDVYVELRVYGLGLNLISESFGLEEYDGDNREFKKFRFDRPSEGTYVLEATVFFGSGSHYVTQDLVIKEVSSKAQSSDFIQGNIYGTQTSQDSHLKSEPKFKLLTLENVTWGIVDFLLLSVVIYLFVWLIRRL